MNTKKYRTGPVDAINWEAKKFMRINKLKKNASDNVEIVKSISASISNFLFIPTVYFVI